MTKAMIIVDMIKGFLNEKTKDGPCPLYVKGATGIIPNILKEAEKADEIILLCDMHDPSDAELKKWGMHALADTEESQVVDELLKPLLPRSPFVVGKRTFSGFYNTPLARTLREIKADELIIAGVLTDICVFTTAIDACYRGYKVTIPKDCVLALYPGRGELLLKYLVDVFGVTVR
jgi:nicotinamidase-related amidase